MDVTCSFLFLFFFVAVFQWIMWTTFIKSSHLGLFPAEYYWAEVNVAFVYLSFYYWHIIIHSISINGMLLFFLLKCKELSLKYSFLVYFSPPFFFSFCRRALINCAFLMYYVLSCSSRDHFGNDLHYQHTSIYFLIQARYTIHLGTLRVEIGAVLVVYFHKLYTILSVFLSAVSDCEQWANVPRHAFILPASGSLQTYSIWVTLKCLTLCYFSEKKNGNASSFLFLLYLVKKNKGNMKNRNTKKKTNHYNRLVFCRWN